MLLVTLVMSMVEPRKTMVTWGARSKPSSWLMSRTSLQSEGRRVQSGTGRFTLRPVIWLLSATVWRSVGKIAGPGAGPQAARPDAVSTTRRAAAWTRW